MPTECSHCNEIAFEAEDKVCTSCGVVTDDIQFGTEFNTYTTFKSAPKSKLQLKQKNSVCFLYGKDTLDFLCREFNIHSNIKNETLDLFSKVSAAKRFSRSENAGIMAGSCLLHVTKRHKIALSIVSMAKKLKCKKSQVFLYSKILRKSNVAGSESSVIGSVDEFDQIQSRTQSLLNHIYKDSKDKKSTLLCKTVALVKLAYLCWVGNGRSLDSLICGAAFLCCKAMNLPQKRFTMKEFAEEFSLPITTVRLNIPWLTSLLLKLGQQIPSQSANYVTSKNVLFHLNYILENSESLKNDLMGDTIGNDREEFEVFRGPLPDTNSQEFKEESDICASDVEISDTEIDSYIRTQEHVDFILKLQSNDADNSSNLPV